MCLAIPGKIVGLSDEPPRLAVVDVSGVRRKINVDLLEDEGLALGDWVLIHVGFAMSKISEVAAQEQLRLLAMLGEDLQAMEELEGYAFGVNQPEESS
jgi:hydrogenase expression/formation protein HypC